MLPFILAICLLGNFAFLSSPVFFRKKEFQVYHQIWPDVFFFEHKLGPNCLQRLSAGNTSRHCHKEIPLINGLNDAESVVFENVISEGYVLPIF